MNMTTIGLDLAKNVFQVHGVNRHGKIMVRKSLPRQSGGIFRATDAVRGGNGSLCQCALLGANA